jgi:hypothetical protein
MNLVSAIAAPAVGFAELAPEAGIAFEGSPDCCAANPQIAKTLMNAAMNKIINFPDT